MVHSVMGPLENVFCFWRSCVDFISLVTFVIMLCFFESPLFIYFILFKFLN